jgi:hypothetical protein
VTCNGAFITKSRDDLASRLSGFDCDLTCFPEIVRQWLLTVDVETTTHRIERDVGVHVIGRDDG